MPRTGRKPKPTPLKILEGSKIRGTTINEPKPTPGAPPMPERLKVDPVASAKWVELCDVLVPLGVLTVADGEALATLCEVHSAEQACLLELRASGAVKESDRGYKTNPAGPLYRSLVGQKAALLCEFGLTPSSRTRVHAEAGHKNGEAENPITRLRAMQAAIQAKG